MISSTGAFIFYNKKLLLLLRSNNPNIDNPNTWSIIGGVLEEGETSKEGLMREIKEEIGIEPKDVYCLGKTYTLDKGLKHMYYLVYLTKEESEGIRLGSEGCDLRFFSFDQLKDIKLAENLERYLKSYGDYLREIVETGVKIEQEKLGLKS